ncbi:MAG: CvpA family protein [Planctomycetota bacterium]|jgi:membrane protein required for colicin V production
MTPEGLAGTDIAALVLVALLAVMGAIRGAIRILVGVIALLVGVFLAGRYGHQLHAERLPWIADAEDSLGIGMAVAGILIILAAVLVGGLLGRVLKRAAEEAEFGRVDRLFGFLLGALKGSLYAALLVIALMAIGPDGARADAESSYAVGATRGLVDGLGGILPESLSERLIDLLTPPEG